MSCSCITRTWVGNGGRQGLQGGHSCSGCSQALGRVGTQAALECLLGHMAPCGIRNRPWGLRGPCRLGSSWSWALLSSLGGVSVQIRYQFVPGSEGRAEASKRSQLRCFEIRKALGQHACGVSAAALGPRFRKAL
jgi:hypothetical protein